MQVAILLTQHLVQPDGIHSIIGIHKMQASLRTVLQAAIPIFANPRRLLHYIAQHIIPGTLAQALLQTMILVTLLSGTSHSLVETLSAMVKLTQEI